MRFSIHPIRRALAVLVAALLGLSGLVAAAQAAGTWQVGASTVSFGDPWELRSEYSTFENVFLMHATMQAVAFVYSETADVNTSLVEATLEDFTAVIRDSHDPGSLHVVASGIVGTTTAWRLYAGTVSTIPAASLITADLSAVPGKAALTLLTAPSGSFDMALDDARRAIQLNGRELPIASLDPAQLDAALEGDADPAVPFPSPATGPNTPAAETPAASQPAVVNGVDYRALDQPERCDRIGWAITDPSQLPATEPELDHRAACAGGVSYAARCGTVPGERADTRYITCAITALVTSGPQELSFDMFTLVEADGDAEYIDLGMSFGADGIFPSGEVPEDGSVSGTASFAIELNATEPLLLEIRPPSLPAGDDPAVIVIEGPLQELTVFD
jgi:hypothetical protein